MPLNPPIEVWQQAIIVVLFAAILLGLAWALGKILVDGFLKATSGLAASLSEVVKQNDDRWQIFYEALLEADYERTLAFTTQMQKIAAGLESVVDTNKELARSITKHEEESQLRFRHFFDGVQNGKPNKTR